ncbi:hypothetical protein U1Q18_017139, partial [Sarracenia purpurea var. burkii]
MRMGSDDSVLCSADDCDAGDPSVPTVSRFRRQMRVLSPTNSDSKSIRNLDGDGAMVRDGDM